MLKEETIFLPSRQPIDIAATPAISAPPHRSGRFILPSPALIPVTSESAERAIESATASFGEMLLELSVSAAAPLKYNAAGLLWASFFLLTIFLKQLLNRLNIPSDRRSTVEIIPHMFSGITILSISANPTDRHRNAVPTALIISDERNGIFIPALPIPIAAAKQSVQTAVISKRIFIINCYTSFLQLILQFMIKLKKGD